MSKNIIIGMIVVMNLGLMYLLKQKTKANQIQHEQMANNVQQAGMNQQGDSFLATKYWWEMNSHGDYVSEVNLVSDYSENQDTFSLSELISDSPKLVLRYSEIHCDVCIDSTMTKLKGLAKEIGKENILLISSYSNPRDMYAFKRLNQIDLPLYNLGTQSLGLAAERSDTPYFFILHPDRKAERVYLFYKEITNQVDDYFGILKDKYFHEKRYAKTK